MEAFASYLVKSVIWTTGFALVYIVFLKNERFFLLNRIYLIAGILTSFIFPLISIHYTVTIQLPVAQIQNFEPLNVQESSVMQNLKIPLLIFYLSGVLCVLIVTLIQAKSVIRTIRKSEILTTQPVRLVKSPNFTSAFSFFSYVFVNPSITDTETKEIMIHEMVHIRQKHWFDLLLVELLRMLQWFNPLVWMYIRFIRQNHEYLADREALQQTSDPAVYKAVLLNQIMGASVISLANSFNYSPNKKRFKMMKNIITSPYRKMKVLLILPVFALVLYSFAKPEYKYIADSKLMSTDTSKLKQTLLPPPPPPIPAPADLPSDVKAPESLPPQPALPSEIKVTGYGKNPVYVVDDVISSAEEANKIDPVAIESMNVVPPVAAERKYGGQGKDGAIEIKMKKDVQTETVVEVAPGVKMVTKVDVRPLIIINGVESNVDVNSIDPATIETITVLKDESAAKNYGEKGKNGVIEIVTKK